MDKVVMVSLVTGHCMGCVIVHTFHGAYYQYLIWVLPRHGQWSCYGYHTPHSYYSTILNTYYTL